MTPLCREIPSHDTYFFAPDQRPADQEVAKRICDLCPLKRACAADQIEWERGQSVRHRFGIFGGMTPQERAAVDPGRECVDCGENIQGRAPHATRCVPCAVARKRVGRPATEHRSQQDAA